MKKALVILIGIDDPECCPRENTVMEIAIK